MTNKILIFVFFTLLISFSNSLSAVGDLPDNYSWDNINGVNFLGPVRNQNFPFNCNSGWAFSAIGVLEARIKKRRNASSPDISLSPQVLLSCDTANFGCLGVLTL
jgi:hypothetical protein